MKTKLMGVLAAALLTSALFGSCGGEGPVPSEQEIAAQYYCPMHPSFVSDRPGKCGICGMELQRAEAPAAGEDTVAGQQRGPVDRVPIAISPESRRLLGVATEPVRRRSLRQTLRTVGRVAVDETRLHHVHTKLEGFVEELDVDFTGKLVRRGDRLLSIYSPELVATQEEYLLAYRAQKELASSPIASVARGSVDLLEAARRRLLLWDIRPEDIDELEARGRAKRALDLYAETSGVVMQKNVVQGMRVSPDDTLLDIADLARVWILADLYETELDAVRLGTPFEVAVTHLPQIRWRGSVAWIAPTVEETTRTVKVRLEVDNRSGLLKPDMFVDVELLPEAGQYLAVPENAVIDTGKRKLVFVESEEGRFEPRDVVLGSKAEGFYPVLGGLVEGERVVTAANFLIDSESSLRAIHGGAGSAATPPSHHH